MNDIRPQRASLSVWPFILIGVGVIWLLAEINIISGANLAVLFRFWPLILIAIGLELLVGRRSPALSTLVGLGAVLLIVALVLVGPSLGLAQSAEAKQETIDIPLDNAESARVELSIAVGSLRLNPLTDSTSLLEGDVEYFGTLETTSGDEEGQRVVRLNNQFQGSGGFFINFFDLLTGNDEANWDLRLSDAVPVDLVVSAGTGSADLRLADTQLSSLGINSGTGSITVVLPNMPDSYETVATTGTGSINFTIPDGAALTLRINTGTGGADIDVPDDAAVRLTASVGTGSINVPGGWTRTQGEDDRFVGDKGVWETAGFASAERQIVIEFDGGTGSLNIR